MPYLGKQPANVPVTADDIPDNSITSAKILDGVITIADIGANAVGNSEMADDAVGVAELSATGTASNTTFLRGDNSWQTAGSTSASDLTSGTLPIARIADGAVTAAKVAADVATQAELDTVSTVASAALPKAGGTMTGNIAHAGDFTLDVGGDIILDADGADVILKDGGTSFLEIDKDGNNARIKNPISDGDVLIQGSDAGSIITALTFDMSSQGDASFNRHVKLSDNGQLVLGDGDDLLIYHDGNNSYVKDTGDGDLYLMGAAEVLIRSATNENMIKAVANAQVNLYYDNAVKLATSSTGASVTGTLVESVPTNAITSIVTPGNLGNINFGTSWATVNTTYYKWVLPSAGTYLVGGIFRARQWSTNGFMKVRLYNNTASAAISLSDRMMLESANNGNLLNAIGSPIWKYTVTGATTLYLQGLSNVAGNSGIQEDSNGMNECWHVKLF
jgi:hypothetical protein